MGRIFFSTRSSCERLKSPLCLLNYDDDDGVGNGGGNGSYEKVFICFRDVFRPVVMEVIRIENLQVTV